MRYLKNINEFILMSALSCGVAFLVRLYPPLFWGVFIIRMGLLVFCYYMLHLEGQRELATIIGGAVLLGWLLGYGDWITLHMKYDPSLIVGWALASVALLTATYFVWRANHEQTR
jgi:hypothetical protein